MRAKDRKDDKDIVEGVTMEILNLSRHAKNCRFFPTGEERPRKKMVA